LKFFLVSKDPIPGGKYIDSELFPRLGFVAPTPTLAIVALKEVTWTEETVATPEGRSQTNWTFRISLQREDAPRLKAMTTDNLSKQMLMVVGEVSVSAPIIRDPVEEGIMEFKCRDPRIAESAKKHLARMKRGQ
jgi:preprotein translocase subunit SecD